MSETPEKLAPKRTVEQLQNQYSQLAAKAGHVQYQIFCYKADLESLNNAMRDLNNEAAMLKQQEAETAAKEAAKAEAAKTTEEPKNA